MGTQSIAILNVALFHYYNIILYKCFIIKIGVHDRSMFPFCFLEGVNIKEQGGSQF